MKRILQGVLTNSLAIAVSAMILPSISYHHLVGTLITAAIVLGIANMLIKPILSLILFPITVITLGIAGWFINALILFITTILVPGFDVLPWEFSSGTIHFSITLFWSYVITSFVLQLMIRIVHSIIHDD